MKLRHFWLPLLALAAIVGGLAASLTAPPARGKEPRFPQLTMEQLTSSSVRLESR
jgi:4-carboxymuconolactone decarboxylase